MQQHRQRIAARMPPRRVGVLAGGGRIAMADREQALGDGMAAARMAAFAPGVPDPRRRAPQRGQDRPRKHRRDDDDAQYKREHRQRGRNPPATP